MIKSKIIEIKPNGIDDTENIRAALNDADAGLVCLQSGVYYISSALHITRSDIKIQGEGIGNTVIKRSEAQAPSDSFIRINGADNVEMCALTLDGEENKDIGIGIYAHNCTRINIHNTEIKNLSDNALGIHFVGNQGVKKGNYSGGVTDSVISDNIITNIGVDSHWGAAIRLSWGSSNNHILRNLITDTGRGGIFANDGCGHLVVRKNIIKGSGKNFGEGLSIELWEECGYSLVEDNQVDHWLSISGADYVAVRRNIISDKNDTGKYVKFLGLEAVATHDSVFTGNIIDGGQQIGISESNNAVLSYMYWAYNIVKDCSQWGAQIQGDKGGADHQYFYKNIFTDMNRPDEEGIYPRDSGYGFRINGNAEYFTFDSNDFSGSKRVGFQITPSDTVNHIHFINNSFNDNKNSPFLIQSPMQYCTDLIMENNTASGNDSHNMPTPVGMPFDAPSAEFEFTVKTSEGKTSIHFRRTADSMSAEHMLWDFGDGIPTDDSSPIHLYEKTGSYTVTLVIWDKTGRAAICEKIVIID